MATIVGNNNKAKSGLELNLDSGILTHLEQNILGTIPQHHTLYLYQAEKMMVSMVQLMSFP